MLNGKMIRGQSLQDLQLGGSIVPTFIRDRSEDHVHSMREILSELDPILGIDVALIRYPCATADVAKAAEALEGIGIDGPAAGGKLDRVVVPGHQLLEIGPHRGCQAGFGG